LPKSSAEQAVVSRRAALAQAEARVDQAASATTRAEITLAETERALADTVITARFSGRLNAVAVVEGGIISANERLAEIIDPDALEASFRVSTAQFARLIDAKGTLIKAPVTATLDVLGAEITATGVVERVAAAVTAGTSGRIVYAELAQSAGFRPGDFVTVRVSEPDLTNVALVPATAVNGDDTVLAVGAEDRLEELAVTVLRRQGDDVIIDAAALGGRDVVAERSPLLGAGIRIRPLRPGAAQPAAPEPTKTAEAETVDLTPERRAALVAFVQANKRMPAEAKTRMLEQLALEKVPAQVVSRLESRMGG
jgi:RND family efflux transporter MFP subunit